MIPDRVKGTISISFAALLWGFTYVATKIALQEFDTFALMLFRHLSAGVLILTILKFKRIKILQVAREHWKELLPLSILGIIIKQIFFLWGLSNTSPSHSALMYTLVPVFTAILAWHLIDEKMNLARWTGIAIAFVGAVLLATDGKFDFEGEYILGDSITMVSVVASGIFAVMAKPVITKIGVFRTLGIIYLFSMPVVPLFCLNSAFEQNWSSISINGWMAAAYLIIAGTVIAYFCHQYALKQLPASVVSSFAYTQPVLAAIFSFLILKENFSPYFFISTLLIFAGLLLTRKKVNNT